MRRLFSHISRFTRLLLLVAGLLLLLAGVLLWQLSRELPAPACRWLEQKLSRGRVSFAFREASISLWRGIRLREVRVHPKRSLGAPLLYADEIELDGALRFGSQPAEWIDEITFRGLQIGTYDEWPTSIAGRPMLAWADLFDPAQPYGALFARPVRIVAENSRIHCVEAERIVFMLRPRKNRLLIEDLHAGALMRIPLFAGLTDFLGRNVPGVDALVMQSNATMPFTVTNGQVRVEQFRLEGNVFSLTADGCCRLTAPGYPLDGVAKLRFFRQKTLAGMLARLVTLPLSKMMEFRVSGPVTRPDWNYIGLIDRLMDTIRNDDDGGSPENSKP
jgi:hypothetical protein